MSILTSCLCSWIAEITDPGREQNPCSPCPLQSSMALVDKEEQHEVPLLMFRVEPCLQLNEIHFSHLCHAPYSFSSNPHLTTAGDVLNADVPKSVRLAFWSNWRS